MSDLEIRRDELKLLCDYVADGTIGVIDASTVAERLDSYVAKRYKHLAGIER